MRAHSVENLLEVKLDAESFSLKEFHCMVEIIDMTLAKDAKRFLHKLLAKRGINYFLRQDGMPFMIEKSKVEMVLRAVTKQRGTHKPKPHALAVENARREIRRELIQKVAQAMLHIGL